jgi:hypothetical protein
MKRKLRVGDKVYCKKGIHFIDYENGHPNFKEGVIYVISDVNYSTTSDINYSVCITDMSDGKWCWFNITIDDSIINNFDKNFILNKDSRCQKLKKIYESR